MLKIKLAKNKMENEEGMNHLLVKVKPEKSEKKIEKPIAFMIVVDASYSMNGLINHRGFEHPPMFSDPNVYYNGINHLRGKVNEQNTKLDYVKQASERLVDMMKDGDKLGLVSFANLASLDYPLTDLNKDTRFQLKERIRALKVRGATNISDALELSYRQLSDEIKEKYHVKLILLSDGEANHGIVDVDRISTLSSNLRKGGVSISTIGVGEDYNSFFMESIATASGGMFYHLEKMEQLNDIFTDELETLTSLTTKEAKVKIRLSEGMYLEKNLNGYSEEKLGEIYLGNVFNEQEILIEFSVKEKVNCSEKEITIIFEYVDTEGAKKIIEKKEKIVVVTEEEMDDVKIDKEIVELVKEIMNARAKKDAVRFYEDSDFEGVKTNIDATNQHLSKLSSSYLFDASEMMEEMNDLKHSMKTKKLDKKMSKALYSQSYSKMRNKKD